jgi:hypothetical protein
LAKKPDDEESPFEAADLALAELADGAFDDAFDAVRMDDGPDLEPVTATSDGSTTPSGMFQRPEPDALADPMNTQEGLPVVTGSMDGDAILSGELETGVGLELPPDESLDDMPPVAPADDDSGLPPDEGTGPMRAVTPEALAAAATAFAAPPATNPGASVPGVPSVPSVSSAPAVPATPVAQSRPASPARPPDANEAEAVQGRLEQLRLAEIVQMMEFGKKTAWVEVEPDDGPPGEVGFRGGQIVWALQGDVDSDEGFCQLCVVETGRFRIYYGFAPQAENVTSPTQFLLLEALRRVDEDSRSEDDDRDAEADLEAAFMMDSSDPD